MSEASFYVIYIERRHDVSYDSLKEKMDKCISWYKLNEQMWIVRTTSDHDKLYTRFSSIVKDSGSLFICKLNMNNRQGWMNKKFWNWIEKQSQAAA